MDRALKLSLGFILIVVGTYADKFNTDVRFGSCLSMIDHSKWNRSFHFNDQELTLKLEVTDRPTHWIVNYIFGILAYERLGYKSIEFVKKPWDQPENAINRLTCEDFECSKLPVVHINLELWLSLGTPLNFWMPSDRVADNGPLGPISHWGLLANEDFASHLYLPDEMKKDFETRILLNNSPANRTEYHRNNSCRGMDLCKSTGLCSELKQFLVKPDYPSTNINKHPHPSTFRQINPSLTLLTWYPNSFNVPAELLVQNSPVNQNNTHRTHGSNSQKVHQWLRLNTASNANYRKSQGKHYCHFQSQQATKCSWPKLKDNVPLIHQLVDRMYFTESEYDEFFRAVEASDPLQDSRTQYREIACHWLRFHRTRWDMWTEGWNEKENLTIVGLFTYYGKWVIPGLDQAALQAVDYVNTASDYFGNSEYALTLKIRNLSCSQDIVLNDYFDFTQNTKTKVIGVIAALCSDSIQPVIEVSNFRRQIVVSPTVESTRFVKRHHYPYFFRTIPSMSHSSLIIIRLFTKWGWRRMAVFRKDDHFFDPRVFQSNGIEVVADFEMKENQLTYNIVRHGLELMNERRSRIFIIEYFAKGTAIILCAAYHLGMHFDSGYVWFLNPWLSGDWWLADDIRPPECTPEEMLNVTSWTFTVGHQLIHGQLLSISNQSNWMNGFLDDIFHSVGRSINIRSQLYDTSDQATAVTKHLDNLTSTHDSQSSEHGFPFTFGDYFTHTYESVIVLAHALLQLLARNPSAISIFDSPTIAETYQELVSETDFTYVLTQKTNGDNEFTVDNDVQPVGDPSQSYTTTTSRKKKFEFASQLRFNSLNERIADYWLLKQNQVNVTVPVLMWYFHPDLLDGDLNAELRSLLETGDVSSIPANQFSQLMSERWLETVKWGRNSNGNQPPGDGSETGDDCMFGLISRAFGMNCANSAVIAVVFIVLTIVCPCLILFIVYYRRKLKETEKRIRQPYEKLCAELKDIDIPCTDIVLNRRVGQGAFGMVYGGEAKCNGRWEAVAVKVIGSKATYEGKTDFLSEAKLMRSLDHRNVVRLVGICLYPKENHLYLIMEFMLFGDLKTYLLSRRVLAQQEPDDEAICPTTLTLMAVDIAEGLTYLHNQNFIHRDIACRNCLVGPNLIVKIGDFGLTREVDNIENEGYYRFTRNCELPIRWMSPEAVQWGVFSVHSDIWSYGIVLYEIITFGVFPYDGYGDVEVVERVKRNNFSIIEFLPPAARGSTVAMLIYQCCQYQWQHRPASLKNIISVLHEHPDCVRPFLTDEPPKPNSTIDALKFQPGAGACMMSRNIISSGERTPSNPNACNTAADNTHILAVGSNSRKLLSTTGNLGGITKSSLAYHSVDSFSEAVVAAAAMKTVATDAALLCNPGRRRHKTTEGSLGIERRSTISSSGDQMVHNLDRSSGNNSSSDDQILLATTSAPHSGTTQNLLIKELSNSQEKKAWLSFDNCRPKSHIAKPNRSKNLSCKQTSLEFDLTVFSYESTQTPIDPRLSYQHPSRSLYTRVSYPKYTPQPVKAVSNRYSFKLNALTNDAKLDPTISRSYSAEHILLDCKPYSTAPYNVESAPNGLKSLYTLIKPGEDSTQLRMQTRKPLRSHFFSQILPNGYSNNQSDTNQLFTNPRGNIIRRFADNASSRLRSFLRILRGNDKDLKSRDNLSFIRTALEEPVASSCNVQFHTSCPSIFTSRLSSFDLGSVKNDKSSMGMPHLPSFLKQSYGSPTALGPNLVPHLHSIQNPKNQIPNKIGYDLPSSPSPGFDVNSSNLSGINLTKHDPFYLV